MANFCDPRDVTRNGSYTFTLPSSFVVSIERNDRSSGRTNAIRLVNRIPPQESRSSIASPFARALWLASG